MEQIKINGLPERRGPEIKVEKNGISYGPSNEVTSVKMGWQGGDDFIVIQVWLHPDGSFAKLRCHTERFGRIASEEAEVPPVIKEKARSLACGIYKSHEQTKERGEERAEKKKQAAKQQKDLDFGEESEEE